MAPVSINLELVVRAASFDIQESNEGLFRRFTRNTAGEDWQAFSSFLVEIKSLYPTEEGITLLLEPGIRYKTLISVMDAVKGTQIRTEGRTQFISLFPIISISDAPQAIAKSLELQARELGGAGVAQ
jgi:hypothetical protein